MKLIQKIENGRMLLELRGDFDAYVAEPFSAHVDELIAAGCTEIDVDLGRVKFMSSRAVAALLRALRMLEREGGALRVVRLSQVARWTLEALGIEHVFVVDQQAA